MFIDIDRYTILAKIMWTPARTRAFCIKITPPLPPNNVDAMIFIFTCLHNILEHNIVKDGRGTKEKMVKFTFLFEKLVKSYCPHKFWPGL